MMHKSSVVRVGTSVLLLGAGFQAGGAEPLPLCRAISQQLGGRVSVKGTAQAMKEGLVVEDPSCPVFRLGRIRIPTAVLVNVRKFASDETKNRFAAISPGISSPLLSVVVSGELECKEKLRFQLTDDRREVVAADGYGQYGFWKCSMANGRLDAIQVRAKARK